MHSMRYVLAATICTLLLAGLLAGCGSDDSAEPAETEPGIEWQGVPEPRPRDGMLEVEAFRSYTESVDAEFEREPQTLVREYLRIEDGTLTVQGPRATLLRDSLEDDSVRAERWVLDLEREGDVWAVAAARWEQRCHEQRGHPTFSPELCL
jgi:hypothetical protein